MASKREYGRSGTLGITVPQANTTVEAEFRAIGPDGVNLVTARLQGSRTDSRQRLLDYFHTIEATLGTFDSAPLSACGFACTGTSYLLGLEQNRRAFADLSARRGYPVVATSEAILAALAEVGAKRIALVSPYPKWLTAAGVAYYRAAGIAVDEVIQVEAANSDLREDTRNIYDTTSADAVAAAKMLKRRDVDAILVSGTGMPTLRAVGPIARETGRPVLTSNLCLLWALERHLGISRSRPWEERAAWEARLDRL